MKNKPFEFVLFVQRKPKVKITLWAKNPIVQCGYINHKKA